MLTEEEIRVLIAMRIFAGLESCNSHHINHVEGQVRGMIAVLNGGKLPPATRKATDYLVAAGIPFALVGQGFDIPEQWFLDRGCTVDGDDVTHPKLEAVL